MGKPHQLGIGDILRATSPKEAKEAGLPPVARVDAVDAGRLLVRNPEAGHTSVTAVSLDQAYAIYDVHAVLPAEDVEEGYRKLSAEYADRVRQQREEAARAPDAISPEKAFAKIAAEERKADATTST